jgi:hypothetical protein
VLAVVLANGTLNALSADEVVRATFVAFVAVVAEVADVAVVADVALPDSEAVMVPAEKLPEASRATMAEAVFALVAVVAEFGIEVEAVMAPVPLPYT